MSIDIDSLSYEELIKLNQQIVERLKFLDTVHTQKEMMQFFTGDQVSFQSSGRGRQVGIVVKCNKKTITVLAESGEKWNISPQLLSKIKNVKSRSKKLDNIFDLPRKK
ncbi:hypothetical protein H0A36_27760 [Endozoicomonas sp. SM1973]|uniref:Uncharacterized protein n=1 Tax=Spartinivicinus marinus TaxID=2994442 RepID=A0A853ID73_9GAMM|nr:hypothetical protein [Spartinivicinus marinus]MCX4025095.1 hypothetical protein [Spartinivicinus marinus]MCX4025152.1 hypothetical protein [Spartinivicinus marinus]MCX4027830.1 hypothetical protein [Spartinivicinus marinus]NYZ69812.1 hypothetical protein [Spartinivicinus marinus]